MSHQTTATAFESTCSTMSTIVRGAAGADPGAPTPCADYDLGTLVSHFIGTSGAFVHAASGALDPEDPWGSKVQTSDDWSTQLADNLDRAGAGWSKVEAWDGAIENSPMPAEAVGEMGLIEVALHGWDLARATGQTVSLSDEVAAEVLRCVVATADEGRQYEAYGPAVEVPEDASDFDRALGLAGRDPSWTA
jgi:uncharacterized protein (TIGR03086 family)